MKGRTIRIIIAVLILVLAGAGYLVWKLNHNTEAKVVPVANITDSYYGEEDSTIDGTVSEGSTQYVDQGESLVEKVNVKEGDEVRKGDTLVTFDTTSYKLTVEHDEADIKVVEAQIAQTEASIAKYQSLLPSESLPAPVEVIIPGDKSAPLTYEKINDGSKFTGKGTEKDPCVFSCTTATVVEKEFLESLGSKVVVFEMYDGLGLLGKWTVNGTPSFVAGDWVLGDGVTFNKDGTATVDFTKIHYGSLETLVPDYEDGTHTEIRQKEPDANGNYMYSRKELASMIEEARNQLKDLDLSLREAKLKLKQDQLVMESGKVVANFDGVVIQAANPKKLSSGEHIVTLKGAANGTVTTYISEMNLSTIKIGDKVSVNAYESGNNFVATIKEIESDPVTGYTRWGENPNNSYYPVICEPDEQVDLSIGEWCEITMIKDEEDTSNAIYIPKAYVRDSDEGSYVLAADANDRLEKRPVKTGKILWGSMIEVTSGITTEDLLAFPYGKEAYEGNKTKKVDYLEE